MVRSEDNKFSSAATLQICYLPLTLHVSHNVEVPMYKLVFFVPESHLEQVKAAVLATGAGRIGDYEQCCFETRGTGQFKPLASATPFIGQADLLERVAEVRVELVCADNLIRPAIAALRAAHPYEEPAFDVWQLSDLILREE